jgi:hypothetical protein
VLVGNWVGEFDQHQARRVLSGQDPFDETTMIDEQQSEPAERESVGRATADGVERPDRLATQDAAKAPHLSN